MSPQKRLVERDAPDDKATRLGKEHRRCHRLGDDFVGSAMSLANRGELLPQVRNHFTGAASRSQGDEKFCGAEGPTANRGRSPLPASAFTGEELTEFSESQPWKRTVNPSSCGCQAPNTTYCYFTISHVNQKSNHARLGSHFCYDRYRLTSLFLPASLEPLPT